MSGDAREVTADEGTGDEEREPERGTPKWPVVGVVLAVLWLFLRGVAPAETVAATVRTVLGEFLIGLAVGCPTAFALRRFYTPRVSVGRSLRVAPYAVLYVVVFLRELVTANVDVAYRVLAPSMPIHPDVIAIPLRVESDAAITTIANSITLTPGTLTMDHDAEINALYVHTIAARDRESVVAPIRAWEDYALVIFEGRDPNVEIPREVHALRIDDPGQSREQAEQTEQERTEEPERATGEGERTAGTDGRSPPRSSDEGVSDDDPAAERGDAAVDGRDDVAEDGGEDRGR